MKIPMALIALVALVAACSPRPYDPNEVRRLSDGRSVRMNANCRIVGAESGEPVAVSPGRPGDTPENINWVRECQLGHRSPTLLPRWRTDPPTSGRLARRK